MQSYTWILIILGWLVSTLVSYILGSRSLRFSNYNTFLRDVIVKVDSIEKQALGFWMDGGDERRRSEIINDLHVLAFSLARFKDINKKFDYPGSEVANLRESITKDIECGGGDCQYDSMRVRRIILSSNNLRKNLFSSYRY